MIEKYEKPGKVRQVLLKRVTIVSLLISATVDAFRGHGFSLLVTAKTFAPAVTRRKDTGSWPASFLRGLQLMLFRRSRHLRFNQLI